MTSLQENVDIQDLSQFSEEKNLKSFDGYSTFSEKKRENDVPYD